MLHCDVERGIWQHVFRWLGLVIVFPLNLFILCALMVESCSDKVARRGMILVWHTTVWMLGSIRNGKKNYNRSCLLEEVVDRIKEVSWRWFLSRMAKNGVGIMCFASLLLPMS